MPEASPSLVFEQIRFLSDRFASDWEQGKTSLIEAYLHQVPEASRPTLLRNLLLVEVDRRRRLKEDPQIGDYLERFPDDESIIRQLFSHSMTVNVRARAEENNTSLEPDAAPPTALFSPPAKQLGSYLLIGELGRGGFGVVWEAEHVEQQHRVALKTLPSDLNDRLDSQNAADRLHKFRQEFRRLHDVNHPNLVGMQTLECDGLQWYFTMDLVKGIDFLSYVRPNGVLDEGCLRNALAQLVAGIADLHKRHIMHRDLKPSNVLVRHDGQLVILDFGLVVDLDRRHGSQTQVDFAGTPNYAAPEQLGSGPTPFSDCYAVGVMLYEALTGKLPFSGRDVYDLMRRKADEDAPVIESAHLPEDLVKLAAQLLSRQAERRPTGEDLAKLLGVQYVPKAAKKEALVGRESQLAALEAALSQMESKQQPLTVFVSGKSGEGKSVVVERFLEPLRSDPRFTVLSGRCYDRESVPFKALDSLIDALCSQLRRLGEDAGLLIPDDIVFLASLFPFMKRVDVIAKALGRNSQPNIDDHQMRQRAFAALRAMLQRLDRSRLTVLFADDLQWGDKDSAEALYHVLRPPDAPRVLFLGSYRVDEAADSPFLQEWRQFQVDSERQLKQQDITVGPLTIQQCHELIATQLDIEIEQTGVEQLLEESGGNAFLLTELLGCVDASTGKVERIPLSEVIARKLAILPIDAAQLLNVISVSGQALSLEEASQAAGLDSSAFSTMTHMQNERLAKSTSLDDGFLVDTYHDKIREAVLSRLDADRQSAIHLTLARQLEKRLGLDVEMLATRLDAYQDGSNQEEPIDRIYDLGFHFDAAGEQHKAWIYNLMAAEQARRQFALEVAAERYAMAKKNLRDVSNIVRFRTAKGAGQTLMLMGRYVEAREELKGVIELTDNEVQKAGIELLLGEVAFKQALIMESMDHFEGGLRRLGNWVPRSRWALILGIAREAWIQTLHSLLPGRLGKKPSTGKTTLTATLFTRLSYPYCFGNFPKMAWSLLRAMNHAELFAPSTALAFSYGFHSAIAQISAGWESRGTKYFERSIELSRQFRDEWGQGHSFSWQGIGLYSRARYEDAIEMLTQASGFFDRAGDLWERNLTQFHLGLCHLALGDLSQAAEIERKTCRASLEIGDSRSLCSSYGWCRATEGQLPMSDLCSSIPTLPDDVMSTVNHMKAIGYWHLCHGRTEEAVETLEQAWVLAWRHLHIITHTIATLPLLVRALRLNADSLKNHDPPKCRRLRKRALRLAKRTAWLSKMFPTERAATLRELGLVHSALGRQSKGLKLIEKSCQVAERQKEEYELAQSSLARAQLRKELGLSGAKEQVEAAEEEMNRFRQMIESVQNA